MVLEQFAAVKLLFLDVDGVLTDGSVLVTEDGAQLRRFSTKDGYAIQLAIKQGLPIVVISGGSSVGVKHRLNKLGVTDIHLNITDKLTLLENRLEAYGLQAKDTAFIGDDMPDLPCLQRVGLAICPQDAVEEIKAAAAYVSPKKGGEGCVREVLEKILKLQHKWHQGAGVQSV